MALKTSLKLIARRIESAIRSYVSEQGWDRNDVAIVGAFDTRNERFRLVVGSDKRFDERSWYSGILQSLRSEFADSPSFTSRIGLVVRNVDRPERIYYETSVDDDDEIDLTELFDSAE